MLQGRWQASLEDAAHVLRHSGMPFAMLWPHVVEGLVGLRRNGSDGGHLDDAWQARGEPRRAARRLPVLSALAERAWLTGETDDRVATTAPGLLREYAAIPAAAWGRGELALWLRRLGTLDQRPEGWRRRTGWRFAAATRRQPSGGSSAERPTTSDGPGRLRRRSPDGLRAVEQLDLLGARGRGR